MGDSFNTSPTNEGSHIQNKRTRNSRGATMITKLTKVRNTCIRMSDDFDLKIGRCYGERATTFRSYMTLLGRSIVSILLENWSLVDLEVKESIWTDFVVFYMICLHMTIYLFFFNTNTNFIV